MAEFGYPPTVASATTSFGDRIYSVGGNAGTSSNKVNTFVSLGVDDSQWQVEQAYPVNISAAASVNYEDKIFVFGGVQQEGQPAINNVNFYDLKADQNAATPMQSSDTVVQH